MTAPEQPADVAKLPARRSAARRAGLIGTLVGAAAAGVAAGVAAERLILRKRRDAAELRDPYVDESFGIQAADEYRTVTTDEGLALHVESVGRRNAPLTVIFVHGFCLDMGTFHFQRQALTGAEGIRMVFYDQPGHGRSGRLTKGEYSIEMLGRALYRVIQATAPRGPIVLVGHSMGGMAIMALADQYPQLFRNPGRVAGVVLMSTSAGQLGTVTFGMPDVLVRFRRPLLPLISGAGWMTAGMVDRARQASTDLAWLLTRRYGFGSATPSQAVVSYVERMNSATPTEVVARYLRTLYGHDKVLALDSLRDVPVLVICGEKDLLTPVTHSEEICRTLAHAELVVVPEAGHAVPLEAGDAVNEVLAPFIRKLMP